MIDVYQKKRFLEADRQLPPKFISRCFGAGNHGLIRRAFGQSGRKIFPEPNRAA
jgi:hypothetical protein